MVQGILSGDGIHMSRPRFDSAEHRGRLVLGYMNDNVRATLQQLIDRFQVKSVIEIGSFLGLSACWFAERVDEVVCIDVFDRNMSPAMYRAMTVKASEDTMDSMYDVFKENTKAYPNISSYKMRSLQAAKEFDFEADLIYLDGDHTYEGVKADIDAWKPRAKKVLCGDDNTNQWPSVQQAARELGANVDERIWWKAR